MSKESSRLAGRENVLFRVKKIIKASGHPGLESAFSEQPQALPLDDEGRKSIEIFLAARLCASVDHSLVPSDDPNIIINGRQLRRVRLEEVLPGSTVEERTECSEPLKSAFDIIRKQTPVLRKKPLAVALTKSDDGFVGDEDPNEGNVLVIMGGVTVDRIED